ncbi:bifunctional UDP-N-acetylglucosamine diphosphorylase/glucosamine-1-phosphate N-acetyltransferase GlmU [Rhodococcus sp. X156]|uniref:bifunctional UDP-N-acetylglucosamine diphosphorylase/glucosamine-1-phosphate N-acetyltransferase GlmU n=1 Tax=Rhodococcus sp. X156 TaxID=2499145 RepID=UPI000FDA1243|nr:bifunctional UDP-N-acetylglucosamine diphosphorylase/glucosamine-1-phosphate N-acetyltransferase GlmU [Rhodococcus sp. X156]
MRTGPSAEPAAVVVLAAGAGTRMRSSLPKVLHQVGGRSLLAHSLHAAAGLSPRHLVAVVGHDRERVGAAVADVAAELDRPVAAAVQAEQNGTGHAVQCALAELPADLTGTVVVTYADVPLLDTATLRELLAAHTEQDAAVTVLTTHLSDPTGYGRVLRDDTGQVSSIVEHKDASPEQLAVTEVNSGVYAFDAAVLRTGLGRLDTNNSQGELYLTDLVHGARTDGHRVAGLAVTDDWLVAGVNDKVQLSQLGAELNRRVLARWMRAGVTVVDPATTWLDVTVELAPDVQLHPGVQLHGRTRVDTGAQVGPDTTLTDVRVGANASVVRTHGSEAVIGADATVGPFAYLRPGTVLGAAGKIGTFVETKNASIGAGSKVPHLTYVGDATVGEHSNIGASSVFVNYDGVSKSRTEIGSHVRTGSDTMFIAPVRVGDGAYTGAGTVVSQDVPPGALAVSGGRQRNIEGWVARKRPGTAAAQAAEATRATAAAPQTPTTPTLSTPKDGEAL